MHENRIDSAVRLVKKLRFKYGADKQLHSSNSHTLDRIMWRSLHVVWSEEEWSEACQRYQASKRRRSRVYAHVKNMAKTQYNIYFATFTFRDDVLENTSSTTRHRYMQRWLNDNARDYVANVDFGAKNGREHYHAIFALDGSSVPSEWPYGFSKLTKTPLTAESSERSFSNLSSYMVKRVANHAKKQTAGSIIFKRGIIEVDELPF